MTQDTQGASITTITIDRQKLERVLDALEDADKHHGLVYIEEVVDIKEALAQPGERNFCPRCGKRTADLTTIHTCTPPRENT